MRPVDNAVAVEGNFSLVELPMLEGHPDWHSVICIHDCEGTSQPPVYVSGPVDEPCILCGVIAPDKIQTLYVLFNGHY